jgi:shikimate dehydrogenase
MSMPDRYAVIGNPVAHSKSPQIHAAFAHSIGADMTYERLLAPLDGFVAMVDAFRHAGAASTSPCRSRSRRLPLPRCTPVARSSRAR